LVEREATARWVRRIGSVAALTILAFLLGELSAREGRSETPAADPTLSAQPDKRYGPNPNYRLTPQINRIIRLAQRDKKEDDKGRATGGGTQLKTAPVQKKTAPVQKKTAPVKKKAHLRPRRRPRSSRRRRRRR